MKSEKLSLIIDKGNTRTKVGIFRNGHLIMTDTWLRLRIEEIEELRNRYRFSFVFLSSVSGVDEEIDRYLDDSFIYLRWEDNIAIPIKIGYETPETLGKDRIAGVVGAWKITEGRACVVIDAGTCITIDYVNSDGVYEGGNICPGIAMRLLSMHQQTHSLPLIAPFKTELLIGKSTRGAMMTGAMMGAAAEIKGWLDVLKERFGAFKVIITGGDAGEVSYFVKKDIIVNPNLVLEGLNEMLIYNANFEDKV